MNSSEEKNPGGCYLTTAFGALILILLVEWLWPDVIPFRFFEFWYFKGSLEDVLVASWPLLVWGIALNAVVLFSKRNTSELNKNAELILPVGCAISTWAGVVEEICFRWLIFFGQIIAYQLSNWMFFGWAGFGFAEWIFLHIVGPIANFFTLGQMESLIFSKLHWAVGAAMISSNGKFRDGHMYQGIVGWINSWYAGMFFFWIMFQYGLLASILIHFLYDLLIFGLAYIDAAIERQLGWTE